MGWILASRIPCQSRDLRPGFRSPAPFPPVPYPSPASPLLLPLRLQGTFSFLHCRPQFPAYGTTGIRILLAVRCELLIQCILSCSPFRSLGWFPSIPPFAWTRAVVRVPRRRNPRRRDLPDTARPDTGFAESALDCQTTLKPRDWTGSSPGLSCWMADSRHPYNSVRGEISCIHRNTPFIQPSVAASSSARPASTRPPCTSRLSMKLPAPVPRVSPNGNPTGAPRTVGSGTPPDKNGEPSWNPARHRSWIASPMATANRDSSDATAFQSPTVSPAASVSAVTIPAAGRPKPGTSCSWDKQAEPSPRRKAIRYPRRPAIRIRQQSGRV